MFKKGESGNPAGRSIENKVLADVRALARSHCIDAIKTLVDLMKTGENRIRLAAAMAILDRGVGKPREEQDDEHKPLTRADLEDLIARVKSE